LDGAYFTYSLVLQTALVLLGYVYGAAGLQKFKKENPRRSDFAGFLIITLGRISSAWSPE